MQNEVFGLVQIVFAVRRGDRKTLIVILAESDEIEMNVRREIRRKEMRHLFRLLKMFCRPSSWTRRARRSLRRTRPSSRIWDQMSEDTLRNCRTSRLTFEAD